MAIIAGGPGYRWAGRNTRILEDNEISLPRTDSFVVVSAIIESNKHYILTLLATNKSGSGKIKVSITNTDIESNLYIKSKIEKEYKIKLSSKNQSGNEIRIQSNGASGNVRIKAIALEEIETKEDKKIDIQAQLKEERRKRGEELGRLYVAKNKEEQLRVINAKRIAIGEMMATPTKFGGNGYRWRGYAIKTAYKFNSTCAVLPRKDSVVMMPIKIEPNMRYKVVLFAAAEKAPTKILVNFFGGPKADLTHVPITITNNKIKTYEIYLNTSAFPKNLSMYLRVFMPAVKQSAVYIKHVECTQVVDPERVVAHEAQQAKKARHSAKVQPQPKSPTYRPKQEKIEELSIMKFKPYEEYKRKLSERAQEVLIHAAIQVPKVSIITPTRDGADLLRKCYDALNKNTGYPNWEWIVGDSISDDDTEEFMRSVAEKDSRVIFVQRGTNDGSFSSINNELVKKATGEYYVFLNNDTEPGQLWLYEMMSKIHRHPEIGIVGARLMHGEKRVQHAGIMFVPQGPINVSKPVLKALGGEAFVSQDRFYQAVTAACLLIRKADFDRVGQFDPIYHFCYEDVDLCLKVKYQLNKKILYAANAIVQHAESSTQKKHGTGGEKQRKGIDAFKARWMRKVDIDFPKFTLNKGKDIYPKTISFVTCVNNSRQYINYVVGSLFMNDTKRNYEVIPIMNHANPYSAAQALNIGIDRSKGNIVVLCHQDVAFYNDWVELLFKRISEINAVNKKWGVLGTAGIDTKDRSIGVVHNAKGKIQWRHNANSTFYPVQTVDEHCMIIQKRYGLKCDAMTFDGFHCYGPDLSLSALNKGLTNYGILCPLIHDSSGSGSLVFGRDDFMKHLNALAAKWRSKFKSIRTTTSVISKRQVKTFIKFK